MELKVLFMSSDYNTSLAPSQTAKYSLAGIIPNSTAGLRDLDLDHEHHHLEVDLRHFDLLRCFASEGVEGEPQASKLKRITSGRN